MEPRWMLKQVEGSPTPPRMLLLDCLHDSTFTAARREALTQALATIHRIMENILGRDAGAQEDKFCRVRMISATWRERVDPVFYRLRVLEWMSFCLDDDGVFAVFTPSLAQCCDIESEKHFVRYRLVEVAVMQAAVTGAGAVPPSSSSNIAVSTAPGWMNEVDHSMRHACDDEASCVLKRGMRALVLLFWSSKLPESGELHWLVGRLQRECAVAQEVGPLPVACLSVTLSQLEDTLTSFTSHTSSGGLRGTTSAFIRAHVAARHRRAWEAEKVEELQADTGDAFRSLSREEQLVGTSLIADIAGLMHQVSVVLDTQGMIREDRMEAHRLLHKFHRDGDVMQLHGLKDEWEARLESAKVSSGRTCVFLAE